MDTFREVMGFLLMGTAVYLSSTLIHQLGPAFSSFLWYLLFLALAAWFWGWTTRRGGEQTCSLAARQIESDLKKKIFYKADDLDVSPCENRYWIASVFAPDSTAPRLENHPQ